MLLYFKIPNFVFSTSLIILSPAVIVPRPWVVAIAPLPANRFPNKLAPKVPSNIPRNPSFCSFASFLIVSMTPFINKPESSRDLTIFMISSISLLEIIKVVKPDPNIFLWIGASVVDAAAINLNNIKTLLAYDLSTFPIKGIPIFSNGPKTLPKNSPDCPILCNWVFDNFMLAEELFAKASPNPQTYFYH